MELKKLTKKDMENTFLPEGYKEAATQSNYMRFEEGLNQFRILSPALTGFEYWTNENKPVRSKEYPAETPNAKINPRTGNVDVKSFWAFVVWNYGAKKIQILELTQKTIKTGITSFQDNSGLLLVSLFKIPTLVLNDPLGFLLSSNHSMWWLCFFSSTNFSALIISAVPAAN